VEKNINEMIGVPPSERIRFTCTRYKSNKLDGAGFLHLIRLAEKERGYSCFPPDTVAGLNQFLRNTTFHSFEGRPKGNATKKSFSATELETALTFKDDKAKLAYLVYRYMFSVFPDQKVVSDFPLIVAIEPMSLCNLRCTMCFQADETYFNRTNPLMGKMDVGLFKELIDEMAENQPCGLVLASRGEPMLHSKFTQMVKYATEKNIIDVKINTNATALTEKNARELLEAEPTTVVFSVDAGNKQEFEAIRIGAKFEQVVANIKRFNDIREKKFPNSTTRTRISMTIFRETQDAKEAEGLWSPMVDEFAIHSADYRLDVYQHPLLPQETKPCALLWERVYVWWDGSVNPCDIDWKSQLCLGKAGNGQSIKSVWLGEKISRMRLDHTNGRKSTHSPCNRCYGAGF